MLDHKAYKMLRRFQWTYYQLGKDHNPRLQTHLRNYLQRIAHKLIVQVMLQMNPDHKVVADLNHPNNKSQEDMVKYR